MQNELTEGFTAERSRSLHEDIERITPTNLISGVTFRSAWQDGILCFFQSLFCMASQRFHQPPLDEDHQSEEDDEAASPCHEDRPERLQSHEPEPQEPPHPWFQLLCQPPDTGSFPCLCSCPCCDPSLPGSRVRDGRVSRTR